jgi:hypothetical protein
MVVLGSWPSVACPALVLGLVWAALGCTTSLRADPQLSRVVEAAIAPVGVPATGYQPGDLLRHAPGWCGGQRVSFGGRPADGTAVTLEVVRFRDAGAAAHAVHHLTPAWVLQRLGDRAISPPQPRPPPPGAPPAVVWVLQYNSRVPSAEQAVTGVSVVPVTLAALQAHQVVAVVESLGLAAERHADLLNRVVAAAVALPDRNCWGQEPIGPAAASEATYVVWGTALLVVVSGIVLLPIVTLASWSAGERQTSLALSLVWFGLGLLLSGWLLLVR